MKKILSFFLALSVILSCFAVILTVNAVEGTTYYVDSANGDDMNSGISKNSAWKTTDRASQQTYSAGDRILFKAGGIYFGNFKAKGSGTKENPIIISSYGEGDKPLLNSTESTAPIIEIFDESGWHISNLEITTPTGTGILIHFAQKVVSDITVKNVTLHDINNFPNNTYNAGLYAAIRILGASEVAGTHNENILIDGCEIYDCGYGMITGGNWPISPEKPYDKNIVVENSSFHDLQDDAFIMARADTLILRNSSIVNACQSSGLYYTAPIWMWGVTNGLVESCEIAGSKNILDGMAIDFDAFVDNSMYQYVYSHDNTRFMHNIPTDQYEGDHTNNTVRYCLSVNDNKENNGGSWDGVPERKFKFYNNTIVNAREFRFRTYEDSLICNNIFALIPGEQIVIDKNRENNIFTNNCYYGILPAKGEKNAVFGYPGFIGSDYADVNSFKLHKSSPCIGVGVQAEEDMGRYDFYGNSLTDTHNIGCYDGVGVEGEDITPTIFEEIILFFKGIKHRVIDIWLSDISEDIIGFLNEKILTADK